MDPTVNVLHVIHSSRGGGAETQLDILCRHGETAGISSTTFCIRSAQELHQQSREYVRYRRRGKLDFGIYRAIADAIGSVKPDLVHAWLPPVVTIPAILAASRADVPVITSFRSSKQFRRMLDVVEFMASWWLGDGVVSNTPVELCSPWYQRLFERKRGVVIPNAVHVEQRRTIAGGREFGEQNGFKILYAGRIAKEKNLERLIEAFAVPTAGPDWRLSICGEGYQEPEMRALVGSLGLESKVRWYGFRHDLAEVMVQHDAIVLPSWYEGVPNVLLEAMALGVPAVVSDIPSHRNVLGASGAALMFPPEDHQALAESLGRLQTDRELRENLIERGYAVANEYSVENLVDRHAAYYRDVLSRAGRAPTR